MAEPMTPQVQVPADAHARSRLRWRDANPEQGLTWGRIVTGDAFVEKVIAYAAPGPTTRILEVGPGYGRLLSSLLTSGAGFAAYHGVDLSARNVASLRESFPAANISFQVADVESADFDGAPYDLMYSSLTFKHLYPSFEAALANIARQMSPGGMVIFDVREDEDASRWQRLSSDPAWLAEFSMTADEISRGVTGYFEPQDRQTFIRLYTKSELAQILRRVAVDLVVIDEVRHTPEHVRLLVVGRVSS
jgi:SAM-dependent methyltransferase